MAKVKSLIKIALKKTPTGTRLVVICAEFDQEQKASAEAHGHTLIDLSTLKKYGVDIIEAKAKEAMKAS